MVILSLLPPFIFLKGGVFMSSVEGRAREGKHKNYDYCIFENQLNEDFMSVLDSWLEEEIISGYVVSPEHNKDIWTEKDERKDKTHVAGQPKEPHRHIAVSFVNSVDQERAYYQSEKLYKPEKWVVHQAIRIVSRERWCKRSNKLLLALETT